MSSNSEECSVNGCHPADQREGPVWGMHYSRFRRRGTTEKSPRRYRGDTIEEKLRLNVVVSATGCWVWQGYIHPNGYGRVGYQSGWHAAHRVSYEVFVGPIPDGMHIDHVAARGCVHRACINPDHLEAVTQAENNRRARDLAPPPTAVCGDFQRHRFFEHHHGPTLLTCLRCGKTNPRHVTKARRAA